MPRKPLRLLLLTAEEWPNFRVDLAVLFGKYLPRQGVRSDLVTSEGEGGSTPWPAGDAHLARLQATGGWARVAKFCHQLRWLLRARPGDYDAIQVRDQAVIGALACLLVRRRGLRFFYWMSPAHAAELFGKPPRQSLSLVLQRALLERVILPRTDHLFVTSETMQAEVLARGVARDCVSVVPVGVDGEALAAHAGALPVQRFPGRRCVVYLGGLDVERQVDVLFEMLALLRPTCPELCLLLVGDTRHDTQQRWLKTHADALGVADMIYYTGWLPRHEAWAWVRLAEVGLSPCPRGERFDRASPLKAVEYLALGLPVLGNDNPDQAWLLERSGGGLCCTLDAAGFAAGLAQLLADPQRAREMGRQGREFVRRERDCAQIAARLAEVYRRLLR